MQSAFARPAGLKSGFLLTIMILASACSPSDSGGVGGSVTQYADQDYADASWERLWDTDALLARSGAESNLRLRGFRHIAGTDDRNLWVSDRTGFLFQMHDGHWSYLGSVTDGAEVVALRAVSPDTVAVGRNFRRGGAALALVSPQGIRRFEGAEPGPTPRSAHIAVLAEDFIDLYTALDLRGASYRLLSDAFTPLRVDREREAVLHRDDNTPIADYPVHAIFHTTTFQPRVEAYALWRNPRRGEGVMAEFRDGVWVLREQIRGDLSRVRAAWFGRDQDGVFLIAVGSGGFVLRQSLGGAAFEQSLTGTLQTATSADLIAVWGRGPDHYWVMDSNGQIWLRSDDQWRIVVRGLYEQDVLFNAALVAPNGVVHAVTDDSLHRLSP